MKTLLVVATTLLLGSVNLMPVSAEPCEQANQSAVNETGNAKNQGVRLFHSRRHLALKEAAQVSSTAEPQEPGASLDYAPEQFIIN
jgi:hypothetical protein